jgi:hypothetical protein
MCNPRCVFKVTNCDLEGGLRSEGVTICDFKIRSSDIPNWHIKLPALLSVGLNLK